MTMGVGLLCKLTILLLLCWDVVDDNFGCLCSSTEHMEAVKAEYVPVEFGYRDEALSASRPTDAFPRLLTCAAKPHAIPRGFLYRFGELLL